MGTNSVKNNTWLQNMNDFFTGNLELNYLLLFSVIVLAILLTTMYLKEIKLKKQINKLQLKQSIQRFKVEQFEMRIRKEEREEIAHNLHDDLSGTLAALKNNMQVAISESRNSIDSGKLLDISQSIEKAYNDIRSASHNLFDSAQLPEEELFSKHIHQLGNMVFPSKKYAFNLDIDDDALQNIPLKKRFELIRVLKEAFVNIVKHSQASKVDLLVYQDQESLHISLKDDGIGFRKTIGKKSLGIKSMQKRIEKINGLLKIRNNEVGAEIEIMIPTL